MSTVILLQQQTDPYQGYPVLEINTAMWELNLHLLEMAQHRSGYLLKNTCFSQACKKTD